MSRIGKLPVKIPNGVKVNVANNLVTVEGPKGKLEQDYLPDVNVQVDDGKVVLTRRNESKRSRALHGLYRNLVQNMVTGVSTGFQKTLLINGVGYRAEVQGKTLVLYLGYSNPIEYPIPGDLNITVEQNTRIMVSGVSKQQVGQTSAELRSLRPPEPYKGKGVRYADEHVRRKVGKSGVK
jgi:large subunit ribosomal protein L6